VDPDRDCLTIADRKPLGNRLLGSQGNIQARSPLGSALLRIFGLVGAANLDPAIELGADWLALELATQGLPLWLYRP
jgi:hypothetical protein